MIAMSLSAMVVGNVVLKFAEGLADALFGMMKEEFTSSIPSTLGALLLKPGLKRIKEGRLHRIWRSTTSESMELSLLPTVALMPKRFKARIRVAKRGVEQNIVQGIAERMAR